MEAAAGQDLVVESPEEVTDEVAGQASHRPQKRAKVEYVRSTMAGSPSNRGSRRSLRAGPAALVGEMERCLRVGESDWGQFLTTPSS